MNDILCPECGHSIDQHYPHDGCFEYLGNDSWCECKNKPSKIAAAAVEQARREGWQMALNAVINEMRDALKQEPRS